MRILLSHKLFYLTGGADFFFFETGRVLEKNGHDVAYFSTIDKRNRECKQASYFVNAPAYSTGNLFKRISGIGKIIYSRNTKRRFKQLLLDFKPDIVHMFAINVHLSPSILDACRDYNVPVVMSCNDYKHICPNYKMYHHGGLCEDCKGKFFYKAITNRCCKESIVFSVASAMESYVHNVMNIYKKNVHTFLFSSKFMAAKTENSWGAGFKWKMLKNPFNSVTQTLCEDYGNYLVCFGRLIEEKGVDILIKAMGLVPHAHLKIIGDGPQWQELKQLSTQLNLSNVEFLGPKWGKELHKILGMARFVVVPPVWHENFPYVIIQSFAIGKPVIGSNRGGIPELIRDGVFGYVYSANNPENLADRINKMWSNPELTVKMGKAAKVYADAEFNDINFYEKLMSIYNEVLNESSCNRG